MLDFYMRLLPVAMVLAIIAVFFQEGWISAPREHNSSVGGGDSPDQHWLC